MAARLPAAQRRLEVIRYLNQVLGGGAPTANSTVTLWPASAGAPKELAQTRTGADGRFTIYGA